MSKTWIEIPVNPVLLGQAGLAPHLCKEHPHITLVHLGENASEEKLEAARRALSAAATSTKPFRVELSGVGVFFVGNPRSPSQTPVVLANSLGACDFWHRLRSFLRGGGVAFSDRYGFQPHVALESSDPRWLLNFQMKSWTVDTIQLVHKDKTKQEQRRVFPFLLGAEASPPTDVHGRLDTSDGEG